MKIKSLSVLLLLIICIIGLSFSVMAADVFKDTYRVRVVVHGGIADPFWKTFEKGVKDAAANHPDLEVTYSGPANFDLTKFISDLQTAIAAEPDALVCTLTEPVAMDSILRPVIKDGMPVIAVNAPDLRLQDERIPVNTYVGEDSYFIGVKAARETLKRFKPERAIYVNHHPGASNIEARGRGYIETLKENGVPAEQLNITSDAVKGAEIVAAYIQSHPETDAIFSGNTQRTEAIVVRLEDEGIKVGEEIKIAQMDMSPSILDYIKQGKVMFALDQQQYMQGYLGVEFAYLKAKFGMNPPPPPVSTGPGVITKEDVDFIETLAAQDYR